MNLILLFEEDWSEPGRRVVLRGRRLRHVREVHGASPGDVLRVGALGGAVGRGEVLRLGPDLLEMEVQLDADPPPPLDVTLALALPRPPVLRRVLIAAASMGVKRIVLHHAGAVEKSYWQSHALHDEAIREQLVLGLEQARDTVLPEVWLRRRFRPFVEDELPRLVGGAGGWVAEPAPERRLPGDEPPAVVSVGPEGGWSEFELERLRAAGLRAASLGPRPLRVETVVPALLAQV